MKNGRGGEGGQPRGGEGRDRELDCGRPTM